MEGGALRGKIFTEAPSFSKSFAVSPAPTVANVAGDDDFEFMSTSFKSNPDVHSADEIFSEGRIRPVYPVIDEKSALGFARRDRRSRSASSCSSMSMEAEDADGKEEFCVLAEGSAPHPLDGQWKSASTGSSGSKMMRIRDLVFGRSRSDGDDKLVNLPGKEQKAVGRRWFFSSNLDEKSAVEAEAEKKVKRGERGGVLRESDRVTAHRIHYRKGVQGASAENGVVKRSYLPYRQDIVAFSCLRSGFQL